MPEQLITPERISAGRNIIRWRGWMHTRVDIITHSVAMAQAILNLTDDKTVARAALIHDLHETEIVGDVPTPDKARYVNTLYYNAVERFDTMVAYEAGIPVMMDVHGSKIRWVWHPVLRTADRAAVIVENAFYSSRPDPKLPEFDVNAVWMVEMRDAYGTALTRNSFTEWFDLWEQTNA